MFAQVCRSAPMPVSPGVDRTDRPSPSSTAALRHELGNAQMLRPGSRHRAAARSLARSDWRRTAPAVDYPVPRSAALCKDLRRNSRHRRHRRLRRRRSLDPSPRGKMRGRPLLPSRRGRVQRFNFVRGHDELAILIVMLRRRDFGRFGSAYWFQTSVSACGFRYRNATSGFDVGNGSFPKLRIGALLRSRHAS